MSRHNSIHLLRYLHVGEHAYYMGGVTDPDDGYGNTINYTKPEQDNTFGRARQENGGEFGFIVCSDKHVIS